MTRVLSFNARNVKALDRKSFWWCRRRRFVAVVRRFDADVVCLQEAYPSQVRYVERHALGPGWTRVAQGRDRGGRGEACAVWVRDACGAVVGSWTRWYGPTPDEPGSRIPGAGHPRIATVVDVRLVGGEELVVANTHLDHESAERRRDSLEQLAEWLDLGDDPGHVVVVGDLNCDADDVELEALRQRGLRHLLTAAAGGTSGAFGGSSRQIDHVLVSAGLTGSAVVDRHGRAVSDHWPVVAEIEIA